MRDVVATDFTPFCDFGINTCVTNMRWQISKLHASEQLMMMKEMYVLNLDATSR